MTQLAIVVPYERDPLYIPRRNLVASSADSLALTVTIVETDDPSAQALVVTGGIGGPLARLVIWAEGPGMTWDYGRAAYRIQETLWSGDGVLGSTAGSFDIAIRAATMAMWPPRCGWSFHLDWNGGESSEMLAEGYLHVRRAAGKITPPVAITTDSNVAILVA